MEKGGRNPGYPWAPGVERLVVYVFEVVTQGTAGKIVVCAGPDVEEGRADQCVAQAVGAEGAAKIS